MMTIFTRRRIVLPLLYGLWLGLMFALPAARAQDPFTRIFSGPIVSGFNCTILAWGDFNRDGFQDLFVSARTGPSLLYSNNGNGTFARVSAGPVVADSGSCFGAAWGDYDNDGFLDLFVSVNNFGSDWLYHNNGDGSFTKITAGPVVNSGANGNNCAWADYDRDGFLDLFVANSDQNDFLYHNNGNGTFTRITTNAIAFKPGNSQGGAWADYDEDGWPDLFVSRVNEPNLLYHNQGGGVFSAVTNGAIVHDISTGQGTAWGDYDNDGHLDLFVVNPNAPNFLYHNSGDGTFSRVTGGAIATDIGNGHGCAWADYDNDGHLDLFVANRFGVNFLYHNTGTGTFTRVTGGVVPTDNADAFSAAWADYDNDGFPDLFVTELGSFTNRLFHNNGNSNNWITVACAGRTSNRSGIGAKVRVQATLGGRVVWQLREISGGDGLGSQNDLRAGFGLGDATSADIVRVEWPAGGVQEMRNVAARQFLSVVETVANISPLRLEIDAGETALFTLSTAQAVPWLCQWQFNGTALPGATNFTLAISNVQAAHAGKYSATLTDPESGLSFTPPPATLTGPLILVEQPQAQTIGLGSNVTFRAAATGFAPRWQWQFNGTNLPSATNDLLSISNVQFADEGFYRALASNGYGTVPSGEALLTVFVKPVITNHPVAQTVLQGGTARFTVVAGPDRPGAPLGYRWYRNGVPFQTSAVPTLVITNVQANAMIRVAVTNATFPSGVNSSNVALTMLPDFDRDGMADRWEAEHFGSGSTNDTSNASADADGDGLSNLDEYRAGTNPNDAQSVLRLEGIVLETNVLRFRFTAISNQSYTVQTRAPDAGSPWLRLADVPALATNRPITILHAVEPALWPQRLYRVTTPRLD